MGVKDVIKVNRKTFINPRGWLGYDTVKGQTKTTFSILKDFFGSIFTFKKDKQKARRVETFDEAMKRLKLTEADLKSDQQQYLLLSLCFGAGGILFEGFAIYYLFTAHFLGCLVAFSLGMYLLANAFRYDFLNFQIKHRRLGCTFDEWWQGKPLKKGHPHA